MARKEFSKAVKVACIQRATKDGVLYCESCGVIAKRFEIDHVNPGRNDRQADLGERAAALPPMPRRKDQGRCGGNRQSKAQRSGATWREANSKEADPGAVIPGAGKAAARQQANREDQPTAQGDLRRCDMNCARRDEALAGSLPPRNQPSGHERRAHSGLVCASRPAHTGGEQMMSDDELRELVKWHRDPRHALADVTIADAIEQLMAERDNTQVLTSRQLRTMDAKCEQLLARAEKAEQDLKLVVYERDATFRHMLARAERAEAVLATMRKTEIYSVANTALHAAQEPKP